MQLAIFDVDGTLTRTNEIDAVCFVRAFADQLGITKINTDWADYAHTTDSGITRQIFQEQLERDPSADELAQLQRRFIHLLEEAFTQKPESFAEIAGASVTLRELRQQADWAVAIATGCWRRSALLKLDKARIISDGLSAAFADDAVSRAEIIQVALARAQARYAQASFSQVVYLGDAVWDVRAAAGLNLAFLGVGEEEQATGLRHAGATHVIRDFSDFDHVLQTLQEVRVPTC